ncbi:MAG: hypothetical protein AAFR73_00860 [Pseudomonadota bacterium]
MKRIANIWIVLAVLYAALLAWHQPLRGPLTVDEVRTAFGQNFDVAIRNDDAAAIIEFFLSDDGKPFFMVNLNGLPEPSPEVAAAEQQYGAYMLPRLLARASYPVLSTDIIVGLTNSLGVDVTPFERLVVVRYRSRRDFLEIIATQEFRNELQNKTASLDGWYSAPSTIGPTFSLPVAALFVLIVIGLAGRLWSQKTARARSDRNLFVTARRLW